MENRYYTLLLIFFIRLIYGDYNNMFVYSTSRKRNITLYKTNSHYKINKWNLIKMNINQTIDIVNEETRQIIRKIENLNKNINNYYKHNTITTSFEKRWRYRAAEEPPIWSIKD